MLTKLHCSSPIATKCSVPCFVQLSLETFPTSAVKKCLFYRKSVFSTLFYSVFFSENTVMHRLLVANTLEIQSRTRSTLSPTQQNYKRLLNVIAHKHSVKYNLSISNEKAALSPNICFNLLNPYSFFDFQDRLLMKLLLQ